MLAWQLAVNFRLVVLGLDSCLTSLCLGDIPLLVAERQCLSDMPGRRLSIFEKDQKQKQKVFLLAFCLSGGYAIF